MILHDSPLHTAYETIHAAPCPAPIQRKPDLEISTALLRLKNEDMANCMRDIASFVDPTDGASWRVSIALSKTQPDPTMHDSIV